MRRFLRSARAVLGVAMRANPRLTFGAFALKIVENVADATPALWLKLMVDAAAARQIDRTLTMGLALAASYLVGVIGRQVNNIVVANRLNDVAGLALEQEILTLVADLPGIEHHERPDYLDRVQLLRNDRGVLVGFLMSLVNGAGLVVRIASTVILLLTVDARLLLLPLFAIPSLLTGGWVQRLHNRNAQRLAEPRRLWSAIRDLATGIAAGKEVRVFGLEQELSKRHTALTSSVLRSEIAHHARAGVVTTLGSLVFILGYLAAIGLVVARALDGTAGAGDVLLTVTLAGQVNGLTGSTVGLVTHTVNTSQAVGRYLWLQNYASQVARRGREEPPSRFTDGIHLEHVTFTYPGTDHEVLHDVCAFFPAGSTVALVGENGAGKTTLVKLLCGFYEPTAGRILLDSVSLADVDLAAWRERTSAALQDFARFELPVRETVGLGDLGRIDDVDAVNSAIERAHARDVPENLAAGLDTQLGISWPDGVELSGGQWQKLAISRAMMRERPLLLLLDEPTSALDVYTEHALFERYAAAAKQAAAATGGITIFISHRFSTVRMADHIIVLDEGRILEAGTHEQLIGNRGLYAELYEIQARSYR